jgi:hypothetical protein
LESEWTQLLPQEWKKMVLRIEVEPGKMILFAVFHALSSPYEPYLVEKENYPIDQLKG